MSIYKQGQCRSSSEVELRKESFMAGGSKKMRVLIAKPGLDGHDRGAKVVARALMDAGFEVIYAGLRQTPEMIARSAVDEDVDLVGLSILSGAHNTLLPEIVEKLKAEGADNVKVFAGGVIPEEDHEGLKKAGVSAIFGPGTSLEAITSWVGEHAETS
jgi:methylmalonyl-CoA mutase C-terminal domain/subunit